MELAVREHINSSGLDPEDIKARQVSDPELAAVGMSSTNSSTAYVIPYFDLYGKKLPFYRVRFLKGIPKYKQPKTSLNHIYFPPGFTELAISQDFIVICEGERKAAAAVKNGFAAVGLGGVDSWRTRTLIFPKDTQLKTVNYGKHIQAKLPRGSKSIEGLGEVAIGFEQLVDFIVKYEKKVIIIFDTDTPEGLKTQVQRAAWSLGQELRTRGVPSLNIKLLVLPMSDDGVSKMGLDDFLLSFGKINLRRRIDEIIDQRRAFPRHPSCKEYVNTRLNKGNLKRRDLQEVASTILAELDARGRRLRTTSSHQPYFFDEKARKLIPVILMTNTSGPLHESAFGSFLYSEFGLSGADNKLLSWIASQFTGEPPIEDAEPRRVITTLGDDKIVHQLSDSEMAIISKDGLEIKYNGYEGLLFEHDQVQDLNTKLLLREFETQSSRGITAHWREVLNTVNVSSTHGHDLATLLFYISPWLNRWRGTQLPVELVSGEAGSGKSSLYMLRLQILTGKSLLRNIPTDIRDWHAGVSGAGGLYVVDNVQFTNKELKQRISDEICRVITEPNPHVEMRKLYTTAQQISLPVTTAFAFTSIEQPFNNSDLLQRSVILELEALKSGAIEGNWVEHQIDLLGSREAWVAHHYRVIQEFLKLVGTTWEVDKEAHHRLVNYEQCLKIMGKVLNIKTTWLEETLLEDMLNAISEADWTMQGIKEYCEQMRAVGNYTTFKMKDIVAWASTVEGYENNTMLNNTRRLGRYVSRQSHTIERVCNISSVGLSGNATAYKINRI